MELDKMVYTCHKVLVAQYYHQACTNPLCEQQLFLLQMVVCFFLQFLFIFLYHFLLHISFNHEHISNIQFLFQVKEVNPIQLFDLTLHLFLHSRLSIIIILLN